MGVKTTYLNLSGVSTRLVNQFSLEGEQVDPPHCHCGDSEFESRLDCQATVAQLEEQLTCNETVGSSILPGGTIC